VSNVNLQPSINQVFPVGTVVQAHPVTGKVDGAPPSTAAITSATVTATGLQFTGLPDGSPFVAYAQVGGVHRYVGFTTLQRGAVTEQSSMQPGGGYVARALVNNTEYKPSKNRPTLVVINPEIDTAKGVEGTIDVQIGPAGATVAMHTLRQRFNDADATNAKNMITRAPLTFLVPPGQFYKLVTANVAGVPAFTLGSAQEMVL
jgi:hypothetical protein